MRSLWITPSRSRPTRLHAMLSAGLRLDPTADFLICLDDDDPSLAGYEMLRPSLNGAWPGRLHWLTGPRNTMPGWTNTAAASDIAAGYPALGSIGDDHLPKTPRWAGLLTAALPETGISFGDDLHQHGNLPTCWLMYGAIVDALGWMCLPGITHFYADTVIGDLGATYVPHVIVEHLHPVWGTARQDGTYTDAAPSFNHDRLIYEAWRAHQMTTDQTTAAQAAKQEEQTRWTEM